MKNHRRSPRRHKSRGWVLIASLLISSMLAALTVTWARHAVLAKKSLEVDSGASESEEATRSGLERTRERMRMGELPGGCETGTEDSIETNGRIVMSERHEDGHDRREIRVRTRKVETPEEDEANVRARTEVVPGGGSSKRRARLNCEEGTAVLASGLLTIISDDTTLQDVSLAGHFLLEPGVELTLDNVQLRGTILTRAGLCEDEPLQEGSSRPSVRVFGDVRLLAGTELPGVAMVAPDARFETDLSSRVEVRGFAAVDELKIRGRGTARGMLVAYSDEEISDDVSRPGYGRGVQSWPDKIDPGAERVVRIAFPVDEVPEATLDAMDDYEIDD